MSLSKEQLLPEKLDIQELVAFLPKLYAPGFSAIDSWDGGTTNEAGVRTFPWPKYNETVEAFLRSASKECWCDSGYDPVMADPQVRDPDFIRAASLPQLKTLITFSVRNERFFGGFWSDMNEQGWIRNILERLKDLLETDAHPNE